MRRTEKITVPSASGSYTVMCGRGVLKRAGTLVRSLGRNTGIYLLSSPNVWRRWGPRVRKSLRRAGSVRVILFDDRESVKELRTVETLCRKLVRAGADRRAILVAMGGGVVGDVAGFVGASYLRGVRLVQVPTTLVAQVDSAIGGKTGVNLDVGKNLVGAFYPPRLVLADSEVLATLPEREYRSGLYEVIKYGIISEPELFRLLERGMDKLLQQDAGILSRVLPLCVRAKARVVSQDERESGLREILNFGHTVGHALETATRYRRYRHGEAVAWGMMAAALLAVGCGNLSPADAARIIRLVQRVGRLRTWPAIPTALLIDLMRADKKTRDGHLRFVLPDSIGRARTVEGIPPRLMSEVLAALPEFVRRAK